MAYGPGSGLIFQPLNACPRLPRNLEPPRPGLAFPIGQGIAPRVSPGSVHQRPSQRVVFARRVKVKGGLCKSGRARDKGSPQHPYPHLSRSCARYPYNTKRPRGALATLRPSANFSISFVYRNPSKWSLNWESSRKIEKLPREDKSAALRATHSVTMARKGGGGARHTLAISLSNLCSRATRPPSSHQRWARSR
jgi:hypothetical protein